MRILFRIGKSIGFVVFLILITMFLANSFFPIVSRIHVGSIAITLYVLYKERGHIVWYILFYSYCIELLFPGYIFGTILVASTISALLAYWSHRYVLTNRSIYACILLGIFTMLSYRFVWAVYQAIVGVLQNNILHISSLSGSVIMQEIIVTEIVIIVLYLFLLKTTRRNT